MWDYIVAIFIFSQILYLFENLIKDEFDAGPLKTFKNALDYAATFKISTQSADTCFALRENQLCDTFQFWLLYDSLDDVVTEFVINGF